MSKNLYLMGGIAGYAYHFTEHFVHHFQIDDPVGSIAVHLCGGILGVLLTPIFAGRNEEYSWFFWKGNYLFKLVYSVNLLN